MGFILPVANLVNLIVENWMIALAALAVFASICLGLFKGAKHGIRALSILLIIAIVAVCGVLIYYFAASDLDGLITFSIAWFPTILFLVVIIASTLIGVRRGLRKSLIFLLHSVIAAGICLGAYFLCITSPAVDKFLLSFTNLFLGKSGLQGKLGVSSTCTTLREVLMEYFDNYTLKWGEFGILLGSTSAYVLALVNMVYRLVFAFLFYLVYKILVFLLYLIYLIFYPERRYKKKRDARFAMNQTDSSYKKHPVGGGCVGLARGIVSGIISLSFIGTAFFVAVGGTGASRLPEDISFGENYNPYISIYRSIESYGDQGIFKILNAISDPKDTPYYLFAADIVFSGGLDDEEHEVSGNVKFREELAAYTGFAKNTLALLLKYDTEGEIAAILRGDGSGNTMSSILNVFKKHEFRVEFENLIDNFDEKTYIINFSLSLADAVIANADDMSFMQSLSADNRDLLQVLFSRNYLSNTIPDERDRKQAVASGAEDDGETPPYITINHLLTKRDAQIVLDIVLSILANEINVSDVHSIATKLIPSIEELSIVSDRRSSEMDPVLGRLYCYFDNKYLTDEGEDGITYAEIKDESAHWTKELRALMSVADGLITVYDKIQNRGETGLFKSITSLFDKNSEDYADNARMYEELTQVVSDSTILSKVLCSNKIYNLLDGQLKNVSEGVYLPKKISYANTYDNDGNLISYGEAYHLMRGLRLLADEENSEIISSLTGDTEFRDLIKKLAETITKDDPYAHGNSLASYFTESVIFRSVLSSVIMDKAEDMLVVPTLSLDTDANGNRVNIINKKELREIFDCLPELSDLLLTLAEDEIKSEDVNKIILNESFKSLLDNGNKIVEGTIAKNLIEMLKDNDSIIIPAKLETYDAWITVTNPGELRKFLKTREILNLDVEQLMNGEGLSGTEILDRIRTLDDKSIEELFDSEVFYYSTSNILKNDNNDEFEIEDFTVIVPTSSCNIFEDDNLKMVIKKSELTSVFVTLKDFGLTSGMTSENILRKLVEQQTHLDDSYIISASVVNFLVNNSGMSSGLYISDGNTYSKYNEGSKTKLYEYDATNPWHAELPRLIAAVDEIFGISSMTEEEDAEFKFNDKTSADKINEIILHLNDTKPNSRYTRLDICYASEIIQSNITRELDKALNGADDSDETLIDVAVRNSFKTSLRTALRVYPKEEIANLVEALKALGMNAVDEIDLQHFESLAEYRDKIGTICGSGIIRGIVTKKIDSALTEGEGGIIESAVKQKIKSNSGTLAYSAVEISNLITALDELGMGDFSALDGYSFSENMGSLSSPSTSYPEESKLSVIYRSDIVAGIITKSIKDSSLAYHTSAQRSDLAVLKEEELLSLLNLLEGGSLSGFEIDDISLESIKYYLSDEEGNTRSYLIAANFAKSITGNSSLLVPESVYKNKIITPAESVKFIDALTVLLGGASLNGWSENSSTVLPDKEGRATILASAIMCATFSHSIIASGNAAFAASNMTIENRISGGAVQGVVTTISKVQLEALFAILDATTGAGSTVGIPTISGLESIAQLGDNIDLYCAFDATRYSISQILLNFGQGTPSTEEWYIFDGEAYNKQSVQVLSASEIAEIVQNL